MLKVKLKITIPRNTPVKLKIIEARTINGLEIELNWKTNIRTINAIPVRRAPERNDWFSACCFISPVNLKSTPWGVSKPEREISAVFTISFAFEPANIEE